MSNLPSDQRVLSIATFEHSLSDAENTCDLRRLAFIDAYGLVGTACACLSAHGGAGLKIRPPTAHATRSHLSAMGFRDFLATLGADFELPATPTIKAPDVLVPLSAASDSGGSQALSNLLWEQLEGHVSAQVLHAMYEGVLEMVSNAREHSGTDALIMGQVYWAARGGTTPDHDDRVQVVIGDTGRGIRQSFLDSGTHSPDSDLDAIHLALEYLVSSVADPGRGQGLYTTMELVTETQGRMLVRSGDARVSITSEGRQDDAVPYLPGVIVALSLPLYPG
jgi:hypothetical protein